MTEHLLRREGPGQKGGAARHFASCAPKLSTPNRKNCPSIYQKKATSYSSVSYVIWVVWALERLGWSDVDLKEEVVGEGGEPRG